MHGRGPTCVSVDADERVVRFAVEDQGPGVAKEHREVIFERFARGPGSARRGSRAGSGLGLALAQQNVQAQGGRIYVADGDGNGARFVIELPRVEV